MTTEEYDLAYMTGELQIDSNNFIEVGKWLMKKKNKTEEEREAAIAFKKYYHQTLWIRTFPFFFTILAFIFLPFHDPYSYRGACDDMCSGFFKDGKIVYETEEGEQRYATAPDLGLDFEKLKEGDKVFVFIDKNGRILAGQTDSLMIEVFFYRFPFLILLTFIAGGMIVLWMGVGWFTFSRSFYRWKAKVNSGKYERSL